MNLLKKNIDEFNSECDEIINIINNVRNNFDIYYNIKKNLIENFDIKTQKKLLYF